MQTYLSFPQTDWQDQFSKTEQRQAIEAVETGKLLLFPELAFRLLPTEQHLLNSVYLAPKSKNISYDSASGHLAGAVGREADLTLLHDLLERFAQFSKAWLTKILPHYQEALIQARTSFRPAPVSGRKTSYRKDDRLLHVDAFPATPNHGLRILRVFSNINPHGEPRVWHIGEPFATVAQTFLWDISTPFMAKHTLLHKLGLTKKKRSLYDHYMLHIHHRMKKDAAYQQKAIQAKLALPAGSTWVVATDQVSHAALSGQFMLEQTFYLSVAAMQHQEHSPLKVLESLVGRPLV